MSIERKLTSAAAVTAWLDENAPFFPGAGAAPSWRRQRPSFSSGLSISIQTSPEVAGGSFCEVGFPSHAIPECPMAGVARLAWEELATLIEREMDQKEAGR
jgi:hypothetical protein